MGDETKNVQRHDTHCCGLPCCTIMPKVMTGSATLLFLPLILFGAGMAFVLVFLCVESMTLDRRDEQVAFLRPCSDAIVNRGNGSVILTGGLRQHDVNSSLVLQVMPRAATFGHIYGPDSFGDYKKRLLEIHLCTSRNVEADEDDHICYNYPDGGFPRRIPIQENERCTPPLYCWNADNDEGGSHNSDNHHHHEHEHSDDEDDDEHGHSYSVVSLTAKRYYGLPIRFPHSALEDLFLSTADITLSGRNVNLGESDLYVKARLTGAHGFQYFPLHQTLPFNS